MTQLSDSIYLSKLPSRCVCLYMYLERHSAKKGNCFHSMNTIAYNLGVSRQTITLAIKDLVANGYIESQNQYRKNGGKSSNIYKILK